MLIYDLKALEFFSKVGPSKNEAIEDVNELRFIDNGIKIRMTSVETHSLSVDTPKDLDYVREIIEQQIRDGSLAVI